MKHPKTRLPPILPVGFITNDPTHPFFYPIHVPNPTYRETDNTWTSNCTIVAPFIHYSPDFTTVYGSAGVGHQEESLPVHLLKKIQDRHHLSYDDWKQMQSGSQKEFAINMALSEVNNPCLIGELTSTERRSGLPGPQGILKQRLTLGSTRSPRKGKL